MAGSIHPKDPTFAQNSFSRRQLLLIPGLSPPPVPVRAPEPPWDWAGARSHCLREARRVLRDREDAEEAVQEELVRAWRRRASCASHKERLGWLLRITPNEALGLLERRALRRSREVVTDAAPEPASADSTDRVIAHLVTSQALAAL